jgi:predicted amidohydrolase YtcJ
MQPIHASSDMHAAEKYWGDRSEFAYAWRSLIDLGTRMAYGSDAPIESPNPFWGIYAAVSRRNLKGEPGPDGWRGEQRIRLLEAIEGFTRGAAYAAGMENRLGMLRAGSHADLTVVEPGFMEMEVAQIRDTRPLRTMVAGNWVYRRG